MGELTTEGFKQFYARVVFFDRLKAVVPGVVEELEALSRASDVMEAVRRWCADKNLDADWVVQTLVSSLANWEKDPAWRGRRILLPPGGRDVMCVLEPFALPVPLTDLRIPLPEFDPLTMTAAEYIDLDAGFGQGGG